VVDIETRKSQPSPPPTLSQLWLPVDTTRDGLSRSHPVADPQAWTESVVPTPKYWYPDNLPTDTDAMVALLYRESGGYQSPNKAPLDVNSFLYGVSYIDEGHAYVRPAVLSAMFSAMAQIPGLTVERDVVDAAGRHGISVGCPDPGERRELIFDSQTYAFLGVRDVAVQEDYPGDIPAGAVIDSTAYLRNGIVDRPGDLP
jgi:hypothetical protein